jgi:hypothetical protein
MPYDTPQLGPSGPVGEGDYIVQQGDCLESIAFEANRSWQTIWNHPRNAALKKARGSPNILLPGDHVYIPELNLKTIGRPTDQLHVFVRKTLTSKLRFCIKQCGEPRKNEPYRLELDGKLSRGKTDGNGMIELVVPANAKTGTLTVGENRWTRVVIPIELGGMDPLTETVGIQKRLQQLGFDCEPSGQMDDATGAAIAALQKAENLEPTGELDQQTIEKIKTRYGS